MNFISVLCIAAGVMVGFRRLNFIVLIPILALIVAGTSIATWPHISFSDFFAGIVLPQLGYLVGVMGLLSLRIKSPHRPFRGV